MSAKKVTPAPKETVVVKTEEPEKIVAPVSTTSAPKETTKAEKVEKAPAKKAASKTSKATKTVKAERGAVSPNVYIQFAGKEILEKDIVEQAKQAWVEMGHRASSIKSLDVYVKPEENMAYYVVNGKETGNIEL